jgi:LPPG:FO 2-phospho-L-lactate transferase
MADACLAAIGVETSALAVARHYGRRPAGILDAWLVDDADADAVPGLTAAGWAARSVATLMTDVPTTARIAADALRLVDRLP